MVCPRGWPVNEGVSKRIGPEGGVITSADGRVQVLFPAGAVAREITAEIMPLNNTNPAGSGLAYRLSPHGIQFRKPVSISFSYAAADGSYKLPDVQGIAYQDETGTWQSVGGGSIDTVKKIISVQSDHFSDWSEFESMRLEPADVVMAVGETLLLKAVRYFGGDELVLPLSPAAGKETPLGQPYYLNEADIKRWALSGPGSLAGAKNKATYKAPASITGVKTTAAVSAELKTTKGKLLLISTVTIINDGIVFSIDKKTWVRFKQEDCAYNDLPAYVYTGEKTQGNVSISWEKKGSLQQAWNTTREGLTVNFAYHTIGNFLNYYSVHTVGTAEEEVPAAGFVSLSVTEEMDRGYISGTFRIERAGMYDGLGEFISEHTIIGYFCVRIKNPVR